MLDKRLPPSPVLVVVLTAAACLSLYRLAACPGGGPAPASPTRPPQQSYLLLLPGNVSTSAPPYPMQRLAADDATSLIDLRGFRFRMNSFPCGNGSRPLLLVLVHSAPANTEKRRTIRSTWGSGAGVNADFHVLFLLGEVDGEEAQEALDAESRLYGDLVQGSFRDSYRNMTYKHVMALKWAAYFCPGARYLLKTDDDVFVNSPALLRFLSHDLSMWGARKLILCAPFPFAYVKRSWRSKWRVSPLEYPGHVYPAYCAGWAVLYSPDVVFLLYQQAQSSDYFWIDDVHVTGTLAARANLTHTPLGSLVLSEEQVDAILSGDGIASRNFFLFGAPNLSLDAIRRLWYAVKEWRDYVES